MNLDRATIESLLEYDPDTGVFLWRKRHNGRMRMNRVAGNIMGSKKGGRVCHVQISVGGKKLMAHRLAWFLAYGSWPTQIDHINGNGIDNRLCNLRETTHAQNAANCALPRNNASGHKGVWFDKRNKKWRAQVGSRATQGRRDLGYFATMEAAVAARHAAFERAYGSFARHA